MCCSTITSNNRNTTRSTAVRHNLSQCAVSPGGGRISRRGMSLHRIRRGSRLDIHVRQTSVSPRDDPSARELYVDGFQIRQEQDYSAARHNAEEPQSAAFCAAVWLICMAGFLRVDCPLVVSITHIDMLQAEIPQLRTPHPRTGTGAGRVESHTYHDPLALGRSEV
jgi:hypothetical protein